MKKYRFTFLLFFVLSFSLSIVLPETFSNCSNNNFLFAMYAFPLFLGLFSFFFLSVFLSWSLLFSSYSFNFLLFPLSIVLRFFHSPFFFPFYYILLLLFIFTLFFPLFLLLLYPTFSLQFSLCYSLFFSFSLLCIYLFLFLYVLSISVLPPFPSLFLRCSSSSYFLIALFLPLFFCIYYSFLLFHLSPHKFTFLCLIYSLLFFFFSFSLLFLLPISLYVSFLYVTHPLLLLSLFIFSFQPSSPLYFPLFLLFSVCLSSIFSFYQSQLPSPSPILHFSIFFVFFISFLTILFQSLCLFLSSCIPLSCFHTFLLISSCFCETLLFSSCLLISTFRLNLPLSSSHVYFSSLFQCLSLSPHFRIFLYVTLYPLLFAFYLSSFFILLFSSSRFLSISLISYFFFYVIFLLYFLLCFFFYAFQTLYVIFPHPLMLSTSVFSFFSLASHFLFRFTE